MSNDEKAYRLKITKYQLVSKDITKCAKQSQKLKESKILAQISWMKLHRGRHSYVKITLI